jgi:hypothetical protein
MLYYVYAYYDPITNLPFYIGKGHGARAHSHLSELKTTTKNIRKWNKINSIRKHGHEPEVRILKTDLTEDAAYDLEEKLIRTWGRKRIDQNGVLTNICLDARPPGNPTAHLGKKHSTATKKVMAERKAKDWRITSPDGVVETITNLREFCRSRQLNQSTLVKIAHGQQQKSHKGYYCELVT